MALVSTKERSTETNSLLTTLIEKVDMMSMRPIDATFDFGSEQMNVLSRQTEEATFRRRDLGI